MSKAQKQGIVSAITCTALIALAWGLSAPLISQYLECMTNSGITLGWLISLAAVATVLATPLVPKLMSWFVPWCSVLSSKALFIFCLSTTSALVILNMQRA